MRTRPFISLFFFHFTYLFWLLQPVRYQLLIYYLYFQIKVTTSPQVTNFEDSTADVLAASPKVEENTEKKSEPFFFYKLIIEEEVVKPEIATATRKVCREEDISDVTPTVFKDKEVFSAEIVPIKVAFTNNGVTNNIL